MKKLGKGIAIFVGVVFVLLLLIPLAFKGKIEKIAKDQINNSVNATIDFEDLSLSLLRSFPDVSVDLQNLTVANKAPFLGDTLATVGHTYVDVSLMSLLGDTPKINRVKLADVFANVKVNKDSVANYDIALPSEIKAEETAETSSAFSLAIQKYSLENINITYHDAVSNMQLEVVEFDHEGSGDLSQDNVALDTHTTAKAISFKLDEVAYLKNVGLKYDAEVGVNYANNLKLTFKDNVAHINDLNLAFDGAFTMLENGYDVDFDVKSEQSEFKSLLSLIPNAYTKDFPKVTTTGALDIHGFVKGVYTDTTIPKLDVVLKTENASLQYPDLPNKIEAITINTHITNTTGVLDDVVVDIKNFGFKIFNDAFKAKALITKPSSNLTVASELKGQINLENLKNAFHLSDDAALDLKGLVKADVVAAFDMNSISKNQFEKVKSKGSVVVKEMMLASEFTPNPVFVKTAELLFNLKNVQLKNTQINSGKSDVGLNGSLENVYGYLFSKGLLKGNLKVNSNVFNVADFYEGDTTAVVETEKGIDTVVIRQFKILPNIEFLGNVAAKEIIYDDIVLTNFVGKTTVKNQQITFDRASANIFKGAVDIDGYVDTKPSPTEYKFKMNLKQVDIASAFEGMDMLKKIAPIVGAFNGRFDSDFNMAGILGNDFMPDLAQLTGDAFANLQIDKIDTSKNKFLSLASSKMNFLNIGTKDLKDLKAKVTFKDSKVNVTPFAINFKGIPVTIGGSHGFDNTMDYKLELDLPAKYLGNQAQDLVSKLSGASKETISVPLNVNVGGTIGSPTVAPDMKSAVASLAQKVVAEQKNKVKQKVQTEAKKKINDLLGLPTSDTEKSTKQSTKSSPKEEVKKAGKKLLKGLFGK